MSDEGQSTKLERRLKREEIPLLSYEAKNLLRKSPIPILVAVVASFLLTRFFGSFPIVTLSNAIQNTIMFTLVMRAFNMNIMVGGPFQPISQDVINALSFIPVPLRDYFALIFCTRNTIYTSASGLNVFLASSVVPIVALVMLFTSTIREEDAYPLLRVDRNKLLLTRSFLNVAFYTAVAVLIIYFAKEYLLSGDPWVGMVYPVIEALTPVAALIPSVLIFLFLIQSLASLINLYSTRAIYVIPAILLIELVIIQLPSAMMSMMPFSSQNLSMLIQSINISLDNFLQFAPYIVIMTVSSNSLFVTLSSVSRFLFLYHLGGLVHTFSPLFGGVWNLSFFDPRYLLQVIFLQMPDPGLLNPVVSAFAPYFVLIVVITETLTKVVYYPWYNFLYVAVLPILIFALTTILFGRKTL
ncbi:MAG: hypothetical protein Q6352_009075 [Candidatus Freyrarchaeum guaymaensis]